MQFGRVIPGRVENVFFSVGVFVEVHENFKGLVPMHELVERNAAQPENALRHGEEVMVEVVGINLYRRRILLSLRA
ncbi:S1 RNA-binding domain-containing protein [Streptomyces poriferorum]|uniref:S1 RNA-binding domain-containing protein n=1 Tax=Streptomyces poriferorum TaxID=2798799 RepID=A0ABY9J315_9ACTN|nr:MULTISPECIES: S1 RNA-binding domain-containing protein [unclassified Streptomyces]MDP5309369.1 S1 RNA-binding domain-containing protein [Streptomyces sp. Alt4]WLQ61429.1 S1 RNA-binding domain-containing protein [Streptomyces sp. Alt2]